jgi:cell division septation protein DedD
LKNHLVVNMRIEKVLLVLILAAALGVAGCSRQQSDWEKTRAANTTDAYELFLKKYPSGEFTAQAKARVKELYEERDWQKARDTDTLEAYQAFLKQYPEGKWTEEARIRIENFTLAAPSTPPAAAETPPPSPPPAFTQPPAKAPAAPKAPAAAKTPSAANAPVATSKTPVAKTTAQSGGYGVQLGAFKSGTDAANKRWAKLEKEYPKTLAHLSHKVSPSKSASGTLYRLQVTGLTETHANSICTTLKGHSEGCVVLHP